MVIGVDTVDLTVVAAEEYLVIKFLLFGIVLGALHVRHRG